ncbi:hypothetical protein, partial [Amnibacterium endophyticum]
MVGTGVGDKIPLPAVVVALLVLLTVVYPVFDPLTVTVRVLLSWLLVGVNLLAVAPLIATPAALHWYASVTGEGPHVPGVAVSVDPTLAVPEIVGTGVGVSVPLVTTPLALLVLLTVVYPVFDPLTVTVRVLLS